jgi:predicted nucleic acid-binding protein
MPRRRGHANADSFAAALAIEHQATLVTSDSDFRKLGHGFPVVWLKV